VALRPPSIATERPLTASATSARGEGKTGGVPMYVPGRKAVVPPTACAVSEGAARQITPPGFVL
jgi:hypothetical protein